MPDTSVCSEMLLKILQDGQAMLVNAISAVPLGSTHLPEELPKLFALR